MDKETLDIISNLLDKKIKPLNEKIEVGQKGVESKLDSEVKQTTNLI